ncbi:MAG TPA: hypothetical protein VMI35_00095 [Puia sp.]|nr:hypothetical protein [Puia sp.]
MNIAAIPLLRLVLITAVVMTGCRAKNGADEKTALLTRAAWKYEKMGFDSDEDGYIDVLDSRVSDCEKDDLTIFRPDGSGVFQSGRIKCDPSDPPSLPFTWLLENHDSSIYFEEQYFRIKTLTDSHLEIYHDETLAGSDVRYIIAFTH